MKNRPSDILLTNEMVLPGRPLAWATSLLLLLLLLRAGGVVLF